MKKKALVSSVATIALCATLITGSTFALFTSEKELNVAVTAANVDVTATIDDSLKTWSLGETVARTGGSFANGGKAEITEDANLKISLMTPGDKVQFTIDVTNNSNVAIRYRVRMVSNVVDGVTDLTPALTTTAVINGIEYTVTGTGNESATDWTQDWAKVAAKGEIGDITVTVEFPDADNNNDYKNAQANISFIVEAVQANGVDGNGNLIAGN